MPPTLRSIVCSSQSPSEHAIYVHSNGGSVVVVVGGSVVVVVGGSVVVVVGGSVVVVVGGSVVVVVGQEQTHSPSNKRVHPCGQLQAASVELFFINKIEITATLRKINTVKKARFEYNF